MTQSFDFEKALNELRAGKDLTGKDGVLMPLIKIYFHIIFPQVHFVLLNYFICFVSSCLLPPVVSFIQPEIFSTSLFSKPSKK